MTARNLRRVADTVAELRDLASNGLTYKQASAVTGLCYNTISRHCTDYGIALIRGSQGPRKSSRVDDRTKQMAALYKSGQTLQEIGDQFGITRERVRQLITVGHGLRASDGGQHKQAIDRQEKLATAKNNWSLRKWGCNYDQYQTIRDLKRPTRAFSQQRQNAATRGIGWELKLWEWWSIWQQSGKWTQRGRGQGYMMCRKGDIGPYAIDNVFIATGCENSSEQKRKKSGLPRGVRKNKKYAGYTAFRMIGGKKYRLGSHPTPELAFAAYLACEPKQPVAA